MDENSASSGATPGVVVKKRRRASSLRLILTLLIIAVLCTYLVVSLLPDSGTEEVLLPVIKTPATPPEGLVRLIEAAARGNRFGDLAGLEARLAQKGEKALPAIRNGLGSGGTHPRTKLCLLRATAAIDTDAAVLLLRTYAGQRGNTAERWLFMSLLEMLSGMKSPAAARALEELLPPRKEPSPSPSTNSEAPASSKEGGDDQQVLPGVRLQILANELDTSPDRTTRLQAIRTLSKLQGDGGTLVLHNFVRNHLENKEKEWEVNRALRRLVEKHGDSRSAGPFVWVLCEDMDPSLRAIEAAASTPSPSGRLFLEAVIQNFKGSNILKTKAQSALLRRERRFSKGISRDSKSR